MLVRGRRLGDRQLLVPADALALGCRIRAGARLPLPRWCPALGRTGDGAADYSKSPAARR